jgi:nitrite reductase/ring-hydroxylating ferredoxin subunit
MQKQGKTYKWFKVAESTEEIFSNNQSITELTVNGKNICFAKSGSVIYACAHKCPHAGGYFAQGAIDALGNIVCPLHRYRFNLENGRNTSGEGYYLKTYPVETREDGIYIGFEDGGLFGLFR